MEHQGRSSQSEIGTAFSPDTNHHPTKKSKQSPRKRVSQACDRCRSRKDKCDGKKPACSTCVTNGRQCSYDVNVKKRGLPEGYVRGMEKLWGLAVKEIEGVEDNLLLVVSSGNQNDEFLDIWRDESSSENLVEIWRRSQISRELEKLLSIPEQPLESGKRKRADSDSHSKGRPGVVATYPIPKVGPGIRGEISAATWPETQAVQPQEFTHSPSLSRVCNIGTSLNMSNNSILSPSNNQRTSLSNHSGLNIDAPALPSETWHLLDVYFSYTHCWLPIIEKHDLLRTSYQYSELRNSASVSGNGSGDHAVLWASIAYAKYQHRAINNIPHAQGPVAEMVWTAERMYAQARSLIPSEEGEYELGHVQALLILALTNLGIGHSRRAWLLVGQAVRISFDLSLNKPTDDILAPLRTKSRTKHVFLGCFVIDTIIAARLNYRPHLRSEDVNQIGLIEEDGLDEWDPWNDCLSVQRSRPANTRAPASILSTFNRLIQILQILNEAICVSATPQKAQLRTALLEKLHAWRLAQSVPLYLDPAAMKGEQAMPLLPHHYHLHLSYFNTLMMSQLLSFNHNKDIANLEASISSARQIIELLKQHLYHFGPLIVPPIFEHFAKTAYDVVREVKGSTENMHIIINDWKYNLDYCLEAMEPAWPVFEVLRRSTSTQNRQPIPAGRRSSQVAFDLFNGISQVADTSMISKSSISRATREGRSSQATEPLSTQNFNMPYSTIKKITASSLPSHPTPSFGESSRQELSSDPQWNPQPVFDRSSTDILPIDKQDQRSEIASAYLQRSRSFRADFELDPMFQEFAAIDATQW